MIKLIHTQGTKYLNSDNIVTFFQDTISKTGIDDSAAGRKIIKHPLAVIHFVMYDKTSVYLEMPIEVVVEALETNTYTFVHIGDRYINPHHINGIEDITIQRTIVDGEDIKPGESVVINSQVQIQAVNISVTGLEDLQVEGTSAEELAGACGVALYSPKPTQINEPQS